MVSSIDPTKMTLVTAEPPTRYGLQPANENPLIPVLTKIPEEVWQKFEGLSTAPNRVTKDPRTQVEKKISEVDQVHRALRSGAARLGKGLDTTRQAGKVKGTIDLYFKIRPKRERKSNVKPVTDSE